MDIGKKKMSEFDGGIDAQYCYRVQKVQELVITDVLSSIKKKMDKFAGTNKRWQVLYNLYEEVEEMKEKDYV